jgi:hypothetical protein
VITTRDLTPDDRQRLSGVEMILLKGAYMRGTPARGAQPGDGVCLDRSSQYIKEGIDGKDSAGGR